MAAPPKDEEGPAGGSDQGPVGDASSLPPPASRWLYQTLFASGFATIGAGAAFAGSGFLFAPLVMVLAGGVHLAVARQGLLAAPGMDRVAAAAVLVDLGAFERAEGLLDLAERENGVSTVRLAAAVLRARIAADRDGPRAALEAADRALLVEVPLWQRSEARASTTAAHAARALAAAELGDAEAMRASIEAARSIQGEAGAEVGGLRSLEHALAQIALAEALAAGRSGERDALREHLHQHARLLANATRPRERALARGLWRTLDDGRSSPYRRVEGGPSPWELEHGGLGTASSQGAVEGSDLARRSGRGTFGRTARGDRSAWLRVGGLVAAWAMAMALAIVANSLPIDGPNREAFFSFTMAIPFVFLAGIVAFSVVRGRRQSGEVRELRAALALGCAHQAAPPVASFAQAPDAVMAARANLALARHANLAGDFEQARSHAEEGLRRLQGRLRRAITAPDLLPSLAAERALASAALIDADAALAEVEALPAAFAHRATAVFSVRLIAFARMGRSAEAIALAQHRPPGAALDAPVEALADLLLASATKSTLGASVRHRLAADLKADEGLRRWLGHVVPEALRSFLGEEEIEAEIAGPRIAAAPRAASPTEANELVVVAAVTDEAPTPEEIAIAEQEILVGPGGGARRRALG